MGKYGAKNQMPFYQNRSGNQLPMTTDAPSSITFFYCFTAALVSICLITNISSQIPLCRIEMIDSAMFYIISLSYICT
jgi:hypothetical protein